MNENANKSGIESLFRLISGSKHCVAFTGAGVSTLSGIRDFRGKNGLYKMPDTEKMFDIDLFYKDPSVYYTLARDFIYDLDEKQPAIVHLVLAKLEKRGMLRSIITQNIDLLHQKAGSKKVIEIHGSPSEHYCPECGYRTTFEKTAPAVRRGEIPECPGCGAVLKPAITFFGESLPARAIEEAMKESEKADLMLVLGSSLVVYPAADLPGITCKNGGKIVIVNDMPTHLDHYAVLHFNDLETVFSSLEKML
ncbi:NAD-dependent protein deacylase [Brucepastera parasyntrophica]|uniref:NAD-dependent protein deacylase n=1 Tax=Brucepastera parasyntrophica TaxID=2880008 RepID=UPI0021089666|nr:NAD-dependent protein deacylase [Brucepastera parasyntrophica]ULQ58954.1 NAD-dependent protein deacylase [Brucepastera parasyntrophica]